LERYPAGVKLVPFTGAVLGGPSFGGAEVEHLLYRKHILMMMGKEKEQTYLGGNDFELVLFPVVIRLFESLNLSQNQDAEQE